MYIIIDYKVFKYVWEMFSDLICCNGIVPIDGGTWGLCYNSPHCNGQDRHSPSVPRHLLLVQDYFILITV